MDEMTGHVETEIRLVKKDPELIKKIMKSRNLAPDKEEEVAQMLRYNVFTVNQFADLSGLAVSSINNMTRPIFSKRQNKIITQLDYCFPFRNIETVDKKFIVRNEKSEKYLQ